MRHLRLRFLLLVLCLGATPPLGISQEPNRIDQVRDLLHQASRLIEAIPQSQQAGAASNIANAQARAGDLSGALATVHSLKSPDGQTQALGFVALAMDYSGNSADALTLIGSAVQAQGKNISYAMLADAHANKGDIPGALRVAHLIRNDPTHLVVTLNGIATAKWKSGDHAGAERTWDEAHDAAKRAGKADPDPALLLIDIATSRAGIGETATAAAALDDVYSAIEEHRPPDAGLLSALAMGFAHIGDITSASRVIKELPPGTNRDTCVMEVSVQLMKRDDVADATETASHIADPQLHAIALREIAISQATSGSPTSAIETTDKIPGRAGRAEALATLALEQAEQGDATAKDTLRLASSAAHELDGNVPPYVFGTIAVTRAMLGDFAAAQADVQNMPPENRVWPWWNITRMMVVSGDIDGALGIAANELSPEPKAYALLGAALGIFHQIQTKTDESSTPR